MPNFTHFNENGYAKMVDVAGKPVTAREAVACGSVFFNKQTFDLVKNGCIKKGDVLAVAQVAGIMAAKQTSGFIPMCHPVILTGIDINFAFIDESFIINISASVRCTGQTGVEMEALTAVSAAALTIYDMCKSVQKDIVIGDIKLLQKTGGSSGDIG